MYVALGDSISIDVYGGAERGGASLLARNRDDDLPDWRHHDPAPTRPELDFALLATDGGTTTKESNVVGGNFDAKAGSAGLGDFGFAARVGFDATRSVGRRRGVWRLWRSGRSRRGRRARSACGSRW
ncbi:MAG: hypothetical protein M3296_07645 [Actinomycetota bacterium]|nr:hypothetical protein [Actinomycetota bacterium]